jgi:hypothetical protein
VMETREISRAEWFAFFETFSKQHQGDKATVSVIGEEVGAQEAATDLPFIGISADDKGSDRHTVRILLGTEPGDHVEHMVAPVQRVYVKAGNSHGGDVLEIEEQDGPKTILQLRPTQALPE